MRGLGRSYGFNYLPEMRSTELSGLSRPIDSQAPMLEVQAASAEECFTFKNGRSFNPKTMKVSHGESIQTLRECDSKVLERFVTEPDQEFRWMELVGFLSDGIHLSSDSSQRKAVVESLCRLRNALGSKQLFLRGRVSRKLGEPVPYRLNKDLLLVPPGTNSQHQLANSLETVAMPLSSWDLPGMNESLTSQNRNCKDSIEYASTVSTEANTRKECLDILDGIKFFPETCQLLSKRGVVVDISPEQGFLLRMLASNPDRKFLLSEMFCCLPEAARKHELKYQERAVGSLIAKVRKAVGSRESIVATCCKGTWSYQLGNSSDVDRLNEKTDTQAPLEDIHINPPKECFTFANGMKFYPWWGKSEQSRSEQGELWTGQEKRSLHSSVISILKTLIMEPDREFVWTDLIRCLPYETRNNTEYAQHAAVRRFIKQLSDTFDPYEVVHVSVATEDTPAYYQFNENILVAGTRVASLPEAHVPARTLGKSAPPNDWLTDSSEWDACESELDMCLSMLGSGAVGTGIESPSEIAPGSIQTDLIKAEKCVAFTNGMKFFPDIQNLWNGQNVMNLSEIENSMLKMFVMEPDREIAWSDLARCLSKKTRKGEPWTQYSAVMKCIGALRNKLNCLWAIETVRAAAGKAMYFRFARGFLKSTNGVSGAAPWPHV